MIISVYMCLYVYFNRIYQCWSLADPPAPLSTLASICITRRWYGMNMLCVLSSYTARLLLVSSMMTDLSLAVDKRMALLADRST